MEYFTRSKREKVDGKNKLVGASIPISLVDYLNLYCAANSCSKTSVIRPFLEKWEKKTRAEFPESVLINMIAEKGYTSITQSKRKRQFRMVLKSLKQELKKLNLSEIIVAEILSKIIHAKSKEN